MEWEAELRRWSYPLHAFTVMAELGRCPCVKDKGAQPGRRAVLNDIPSGESATGKGMASTW